MRAEQHRKLLDALDAAIAILWERIKRREEEKRRVIAEVIPELRRCACNDRDPLSTLWDEAYVDVADYAKDAEGGSQQLTLLSSDDLRNLFLLVAEAMESA